MGKSNSNSSDDRLSNLPDSLIFEIFWLLPIRDVVRTTKLSCRWKDLWKTSPFLNFSDYRLDVSFDRLRDFYNRALLFWRGTKLLKFKIMIHRGRLSIPLVSDIDVWVIFAREKQVEELYLDLLYPQDYYYDYHDEYRLYTNFGSLYMCSSLKVLSLKRCPFYIEEDENVKWDQLKSLTIDCPCLDEDDIHKVLCGSPKLEVLILTLTDSKQNLRIRSSSLRKLSIRKNLDGVGFDAAHNASRYTELEIRTPILETLELSGLPYGKFLASVSSLTDVTLGFYDRDEYGTRLELDMFLEESLKQIIPVIQDVESVSLSDWCIEVLGDMRRKGLLSPLKVKVLKLTGSFSKYKLMAHLLRSFPKLKRLVIEDEGNSYNDSDSDDEFEANFPKFFLLHLRTIEVIWAEEEKFIFSFIEILLKYASNLERMVFQVKGGVPPTRPSHSLDLASQKLLAMPRSSPTAKILMLPSYIQHYSRILWHLTPFTAISHPLSSTQILR